MAKRQKQSAVENVMNWISRLPWWVGFGMAAVIYGALHTVSSLPMPAAKTPEDIAQLATGAILRGLAYAGQFVLPFLCVMGALLSAVRRRERSHLPNDVGTANSSAQALQGMSWQAFEKLVGEGFRRRGYMVQEQGGNGPDGGVDLTLTKASETSFVQCKHWKALQVGVPVIRELYGVMAAHGASAGFVVTSGRFTQEATAFASGRNIRLIDGAALLQLIRETAIDRSPPPSIASGTLAACSTQAILPALSDPPCPKCGHAMIRRTAKRGVLAGQSFWGCSVYPSCRGTRHD